MQKLQYNIISTNKKKDDKMKYEKIKKLTVFFLILFALMAARAVSLASLEKLKKDTFDIKTWFITNMITSR